MQNKMRSPVAFVLESYRRVDKRKLDFFAGHVFARNFDHFYTTSPTPNGRTMANDSVLHAQQQLQWDHRNQLVVISLL
jgi:hypothetical protein